MFGKRKPENMSVEELEKMLLVKRRQSRLERFERLSGEGRSINEALVGVIAAPPTLVVPHAPNGGGEMQLPVAEPAPSQEEEQKEGNKPLPPKEKTRSKKIMDALLLGLEVVALAGLIGVLVASYFNLKELNSEVSLAQQNVVEQQVAAAPVAATPITVARLPGGHSPPTSPGGAVPDVPPHLQQWVQSGSPSPTNLLGMGAIGVTPQEATPPTRIVIPKIGVNAPIINGVSWEDLKKGVGHLPGSANPGERGNLYLAAHNDIYGEIFRHLEDLEVGDELFIYAGEEKFRYVVQEKRIIGPTDVDVMLPTTEPVATLQTCYPYMVDTHRLIIISKLAD